MKRILALFLALLCMAACGGCGKKEPALLEEHIPNDNCRNWYEIFVYSFADSDGDRIGDLRGATEKLEYVRDLGFTGIWLMPVMPSPSYHKYDVTDYYAIDPAYGTMEDFQTLLARAHELGIKVILDLVVNHTSIEHPWFQNAKTGPNAEYRNYYNFTDKAQSGYNRIGDAYFESRFVSSMPDLNLDCPEVRQEIREILRYWLEMGVDGFRLDAVTSYYTGQQKKNVEFLAWLTTEAKAIKPECYIVGEAWADESSIASYYPSGTDSFFCFPVAGAGGRLCQIMEESAVERGRSYGEMTLALEERFGDALMAPFLGNHDMDRISNAVGTYDGKRLKAAFGMLAMMRGGIFFYYGDEIGMLGKGNDPNKRIGMLWTTRAETTQCPPGTTEAEYVLPSVQEQEKDRNSLLNYVRAAMNLRNAEPAIARGKSRVLPHADGDLCVIERSYEGRTVTIVLNLSGREKSVQLEAEKLIGALDANVESGVAVRYTGGTLYLDPWDIAVLN